MTPTRHVILAEPATAARAGIQVIQGVLDSRLRGNDDERTTDFDHICEEHPEMQGYESHVLETIQRGGRFQDSVRPDMFLYYRDFEGLPAGNSTIVVVVRFGFTPSGTENNFIVTAYQIFRHRR